MRTPPPAKPLHTPYDGSAKLFQIGLKPLDVSDWIEVDDQLRAYLEEKQRLAEAHLDRVWMSEPGSEPAQAEALALLAGHLPARFPQIYRRDGAAIDIVPAGRRVLLDDPASPPLRIAANLVQDDLCLMQRNEAGWRLTAASLSFPSSWALAEKLGRPMHDIHGPVPGFGENTRNAELIDRMFTNLRPEILVIRWNFSAYGDDRLFHPESADPARLRFGPVEHPASVFLRVERQTLRKLPKSGAILFAIGIHVDPLEALEQHPDAQKIAAALAAQVMELSPKQLDYKGLTLERDRLVRRLGEIGR